MKNMDCVVSVVLPWNWSFERKYNDVLKFIVIELSYFILFLRDSFQYRTIVSCFNIFIDNYFLSRIK